MFEGLSEFAKEKGWQIVTTKNDEKSIIDIAGTWIGLIGGLFGIAGGITGLIGYFHARDIETLQERRSCISDLSPFPSSTRQAIQDFTSEFFKWIVTPDQPRQASAKKSGVALIEQLEKARAMLAKYDKAEQGLDELINVVNDALKNIKSGSVKGAPLQDYIQKVDDFTSKKSFSEKCSG